MLMLLIGCVVGYLYSEYNHKRRLIKTAYWMGVLRAEIAEIEGRADAAFAELEELLNVDGDDI